MKQKDKELVLKEISSRFPYGVKVFSKILNKPTLVKGITDDFIWVYVDEDNYEWEPVEDVKLYLRPMSSITKKEKKEIEASFSPTGQELFSLPYVDYLNSIHIDYRGLIPIGLAIAITKENNPYKE